MVILMWCIIAMATRMVNFTWSELWNVVHLEQGNARGPPEITHLDGIGARWERDRQCGIIGRLLKGKRAHLRGHGSEQPCGTAETALHTERNLFSGGIKNRQLGIGKPAGEAERRRKPGSHRPDQQGFCRASGYNKSPDEDVATRSHQCARGKIGEMHGIK
jgi:hypothetical protein